MIARLQGGRRELSELEKEEVRRYGYTGLEIMTYLEDNRYPGRDWDVYYRWIQVEAGGHMRIQEMLLRKMVTYKDIKALITHDGIKPGDIRIYSISIFTYPPGSKDDMGGSLVYLNTKDIYKAKDIYMWINSTRRIRRSSAEGIGDDILGADFTEEDNTERQPWHEEHRILGEDILRGHDCLVVESQNKLHKNYYLSKRVTWVEKKNFLDMHEEQFDREGKIFRLFDFEWKQFPPQNYWAKTLWNVMTLSSRHRSIWQYFDYIFDQGLTKKDFSRKILGNPILWRQVKVPPQPKGSSDLAPEPEIRWEFWEKIKVKPEIKE